MKLSFLFNCAWRQRKISKIAFVCTLYIQRFRISSFWFWFSISIALHDLSVLFFFFFFTVHTHVDFFFPDCWFSACCHGFCYIAILKCMPGALGVGLYLLPFYLVCVTLSHLLLFMALVIGWQSALFGSCFYMVVCISLYLFQSHWSCSYVSFVYAPF